ncbi:MAG: DinB family protein [Dehalococcoidia bacterium]|nr:DinB family protein [Dehalococcoidia bacterium]
MEMRDFIQAGLDRVRQATLKALDGLSHNELGWRPGAEANSIGLVLFHTVRSEDQYVQTRIQGKPQVWETKRWYEKMDLPVSETGYGYTAEQCASFRVPEGKDLLAYAEAVRTRTLDYVRGMSPDKFDKIINTPRGDLAIGVYLANMVVHLAQHAGEIAYIRGLQRGLNK